MFVCIFRDGAGECLDTGGGGVQTLDVPRYKVHPVCRAPCLVWGPLYNPCDPPSEGNSLAGSRMKVAGCWHWWPGDMCWPHCTASPGTVLWSSSGPGIRYRDRLSCVHSHSKSIKYPVSSVSYTLSVFITHCIISTAVLRRAWPYPGCEAALDTYELDWVSDIVLLRARAEHTLRLQPVLSTSKQH